MSRLQTMFTDTLLKLKEYPAKDVLTAAVKEIDRGETATGIALLQKNPDALKEPVENGRTLVEKMVRNNFGRLAMMAAAFPQALECKDPATGSTLLMRLAAEGQRVMFIRLAGLGADIHARDNENNTLMHYAALSKGVDVMLEAVKLGCGKNPVNNFGETPLMHLSRSDKDAGVVDVYLSSGFKLNSFDNQGFNATMHAMQNLRLDLATDFMNAGGEVNFDEAQILVVARAKAQKTTVGGGDFVAAMAKRHGAQRANKEADAVAEKTEKANVEKKAAADVVDSMHTGIKRKPTLKTVKFRTPGGSN